MMLLLQAAPLFVFAALVIAAALHDATTYTIPNWISGGLIAGFVLAALTSGLPAPVIGVHAAIGVGALVAGMAMFALGWIGGGDAKVFATAALWMGWPASLDYLLLTCVAGGGLALALMALRSSVVRPLAQTGPAWFGRLATPGESVPYGVAIAVGALAAFPNSALMQVFPGLN